MCFDRPLQPPALEELLKPVLEAPTLQQALGGTHRSVSVHHAQECGGSVVQFANHTIDGVLHVSLKVPREFILIHRRIVAPHTDARVPAHGCRVPGWERVWLTGRVDILTDFDAFMRGLAQHRLVFHSEADFQLALAWRLQAELPHAAVRLETRPRPGIHLDLLCTVAEHPIAIELKYLTAVWSERINDEQFDLLPQGAQDIRAYDCVKDVKRVEQFVSTVAGGAGLVLVLTNDPAYWRAVSHGRQTNADAFRLREGSTLTGKPGMGFEHRRWHDARTRESTGIARYLYLSVAGLLFDRWKEWHVPLSPARREANPSGHPE